MHYKTFFMIGASALGFAACSQQTRPEVSGSQVLGVLEVKFDSATGTQAAYYPNRLNAQTVLNDSQIDVVSAGGAIRISENTGPRTFDYVAKNFTVTNNTGAAVNNLTLVALEQIGNLNGAIKSATSFGGGATDANAASNARPSHAMIASAGAVSVDTSTPARAGFQALTAAEATAIQNDPNFAAQGLTGTVLEYGFVATNAAGTNRTIVNGGTGNLTIVYRFPASATGTYNFVLTFVVTAEAANRVTRSPEETNTNANARATTLGATEKVLIDDSTVVTTPPPGFSVQNNVKISTTKDLLTNSAEFVIARIYTSSANNGAYEADFVEIFNVGEFSGTLNGKSLQYANANGNIGSSNGDTKDVSSIGIVPPGDYRLVVTDVSGTPGGGDSATRWTNAGNGSGFGAGSGGKIALVNQVIALDCGGNTVCSPTQNSLFVDLLGYGGASKFETTPFTYSTQPTNVQALSRKDRGCAYTAENNSTEFEIANVSNSVRSSSTSPFICP